MNSTVLPVVQNTALTRKAPSGPCEVAHRHGVAAGRGAVVDVALELADVLHGDMGALVASWLPSAGDAWRARARSRSKHIFVRP